MEERPRARDIGLIIGSLRPGPLNAITDVEGVKVGHVSLIKGSGELVPGKGPVRTGITVILPHPGNLFKEKVRAACYVINGFGKPIGLAQVSELGLIETPIALTNTLNVGIVADALIEYMLNLNEDIGVTTGTVNPVVLECNDGFLNDIRGRHVKHEHVFEALSKAKGGSVEEGCVGAGTGMSAFEFKGGIGTASRRIPAKLGGFTVGVLVLTNFGKREDLLIMGVPVGRELRDYGRSSTNMEGSIVVIIATDAPLTSRQLSRLCKRATHGIARTGGMSSHGSGDFVIAFTTKNKVPHYCAPMLHDIKVLREEVLSSLFRAVIEAVEEAIINSLLRATTMVGRDGHVRHAIPIDRLIEIMKRYRRIS
ncbi:MAG: P1 family peptidase [Thermoprotei archaeon]|nr:P1 family peptidase [Thermoprotei archaeon]